MDSISLNSKSDYSMIVGRVRATYQHSNVNVQERTTKA